MSLTESTKIKLSNLYNDQKMSIIEIAKLYRVSPYYIAELMEKMGVKRRTLTEAAKLSYSEGRRPRLKRENSPHWRGGRLLSTNGYIHIKAPDDCPKDLIMPQNTYVAEHRYVYYKTYGINPKGRVVHHLNGIKIDNRPENLVLTSRGEHETDTLLRLAREQIFHLEGILQTLTGSSNRNI